MAFPPVRASPAEARSADYTRSVRCPHRGAASIDVEAAGDHQRSAAISREHDEFAHPDLEAREIGDDAPVRHEHEWQRIAVSTDSRLDCPDQSPSPLQVVERALQHIPRFYASER